MKLIIEIPEWKYKSICEGIEASKRCDVVGIDPDIHKAVYNGTPLDDVKAEIDKLYDRIRPYNIDVSDGLDMALDILDHIGKAESEDK